MLNIVDLSVNYGSFEALRKVSFEMNEGQWMMLIGPNGAGKSTIVKAISQSVNYDGSIFYKGKDLNHMMSKERGREIAVLSQSYSAGYGFKVEEVVKLGRYPHSSGFLSKQNEYDLKIVEDILEITGLKKLRNKSILTLSGGELQRTFLAQVLVQEPKLLILDEPTNHLDLVYQKQIFELISNWIKESGRAVLSVTHDLSLAKAFGSHASLLKSGKLISTGLIEEVMTHANLNNAYSMDVSNWMKTIYQNW